MADKKIIERIFKVLQLKNSPNENEAAMAAARAAQMLAQYNLTEEEVLGTDPNRRREDLGHDTVSSGGQNAEDLRWVTTLGAAVAMMCFCKDLYYREGTYITFVGTEVNKETARRIYRYILDQILRLTDEEVTRRYTAHRTRIAEIAAEKVDRTEKKRYSTPEILDAAAMVLREHGDMHHKDLVEKMAEQGMALPTGEIVRGVWARIMADIKAKGTRSRFRAPRPGWFGVVGVQTGQSTVRDLPNVKAFRWSYMNGMVDRVSLRLCQGFNDYIKQMDARQQSEEQEARFRLEGEVGAGTALVRKHQDLAKQYVEQTWGASKPLKMRRSKSVDTGAYRKGYDEGERVELTDTTRLS